MLDNRAMPASLNRVRSVLSACAVVALTVGCSLAVAAGAGPELGSLRGRFPATTIDTVERADAALAATAGAKGQVEKDYRSDAQGCAKTFLVNDCLDRARELRKKRLDEITSVELEADRFKRKDRSARTEADRARREADRAANQKTDDRQRARSRESFDSKQAQAKRDDAAKEKGTQTRKPTAKHAPPPAPDDAAKRAKTAASYTNKVSEAKAHEAEIARRVAANTADRKRRAEEKAAKAAKAAVPPVKP